MRRSGLPFMPMSDPMEQMSPEAFTSYVSIPNMLSDDEIAHWIRTHSVTAQQKLDFLEALQKVKPNGVQGIVRTALREWEGLPPVPGDPR